MDLNFLKFLAGQKLITADKASLLEKEVNPSGSNIEELLLNQKVLSENELTIVKGKYFGLPVKTFLPQDTIPQDVLALIPEDAARNYKVISLAKDKSDLSIGMLHPEDLRAQEAIKYIAKRLHLGIKVYVVTQSDLKRLWTQYQTFAEDLRKILTDLQQDFSQRFFKDKAKPTNQAVNLKMQGAIAEEAPIIKLLSAVFTYAVRTRASDIHIEPLRDKLRIRLRVDGNLSSNIFLPLEIHSAIISRVKVMSNLKIDETRIPQDGRFHTYIDEKEIDYRVSSFPTTLGEKIAIRVLDPTIGLKSVKDLGIDGHNAEVLSKAIVKPYGMILITGPTGSGKTTTLYAMLQELNKDGVNIISLEDPVEYTVEGVNQSQVLPEIGYTFANGLRSILRQDPDVIMVGEIRDDETADLAIHAALTGHIVLATLHTNNAVGVVPRLLDMGAESFLLPPALSLMISQRLVRRLCPDCTVEVSANEMQTKIIDEALSDLPLSAKNSLTFKKPYTLYVSKGCQTCNNKGYLGRIGIFEALEMSPELGQIIYKKGDSEIIAQEAKRQGMISLRQDGVLKALSGQTTLEEVIKTTDAKN
ncbi:MAG: GspE/PulE family protein [Candidatus Parcubacteria bacterium]|nr:GspE/PulE family protein [Candidatus Parcubacteria bacterium]